MPKVAVKVAQWAEDEIDAYQLGAKGLRLRVNYIGNGAEDTEAAIKKIVDKYALVDTPLLCVFELGHEPDGISDDAERNPHYHVYFVSCHTIKTVRSAVAKIWHGNEGYSLKKADPKLTPEHFNYLCKGTGTGSDDQPNVIYCSSTFTDDRIAELHGLYWTNNDAFKAASKKRKASSISEQVFDLCKHLPPPICRSAIYDIVHDYYKKRILHWNPDYVRKLVYQTQMYLEPSDSRANLDMKSYCVGLPFRPE